MYRLTCDTIPLLDWRDEDLILVNPKVKLEVNTVGEGSFTIYKNHPHYNSIRKLKSVFEVADDNGVIFRGRATGDTIDLDHGKQVDLEGAMAYFNDSIVRPFDFPVDFEGDANYIAAANSGNVIAFFLGWLIDNHNSQVQDFQKMKLGNVTVTDPNNYIVRSNSDYASTWETLKAGLFESALGGYLCIRYEADGNYIDYLSEFTETNEQEIVYSENLLTLRNETEATDIYSAIIPIGALGLTLEGMADGNITDDIVKSGDTLYSKKAVAEYGWIYAPIVETTWDDAVNDTELRAMGVEKLTSGTVAKTAIEASAVDLHFTDEQVQSLRIYKNVNVYSAPHGIAESFPLKKLEIELLKPQNTKITVGKTFQTLTDQSADIEAEFKKQYSKLSKTDEEIRLEVRDEVEGLHSEIKQTADGIKLEVSQVAGTDGKVYSSIELTVGNNTYTGMILMEGNVNVSGQLSADALYAAKGDIADLTVDRLSTSRRIVKYLAGDTSDDNYIQAEDETLAFITGVYNGGEEQAKNPNGLALYWEQNIAGATIGTDGYPYANGVRVFTTTSTTAWPVMVYTYTEDIKGKLAFEREGGVYVPVFTLGAGDEHGNNIMRMAKKVDGLEIMYSPTSGDDIGLKMGREGYMDLTGLRKPTDIAFQNNGFTVTVDGGLSETFTYTYDENGKISGIEDGMGHVTTVSGVSV